MYKYPRNVYKKFQKDISSRTGDIPIFVILQKGSKPTNRLTDIQVSCNIFELVTNILGMSLKFQKDISSGTKDIKQFSQLITDGRTDGQV